MLNLRSYFLLNSPSSFLLEMYSIAWYEIYCGTLTLNFLRIDMPPSLFYCKHLALSLISKIKGVVCLPKWKIMKNMSRIKEASNYSLP